MKNLKDFKSFNDEKSQNYLSQSAPKGKLTSNIFDSNKWMYKLFLCLATPIKVLTGLVYDIAKNVDLDKADELITEWELSAKTPEESIILDTLPERIASVKRKISKYPISNLDSYFTGDDYSTFEKYIELTTGYSVRIKRATDYNESDVFPLSFPIVFGTDNTRQSLLFFIEIDVVYEVDQDVINIIDNELKKIFPAFCGWGYKGVQIMLGLSNLYNVLANGIDSDHDIDISSGIKMMDSTDSILLTSINGTIEIDAEFGTGDGGMYVGGTVAADTTYHIFMIQKDSDSSIAYYFDISLTAANIPTGYSVYIRLWSVLTDSSANIYQFTQLGKDCQWDEKILYDCNFNVLDGDRTVTFFVPEDILKDINFSCTIDHTTSGPGGEWRLGFGSEYLSEDSGLDDCDLCLYTTSSARRILGGNFKRKTLLNTLKCRPNGGDNNVQAYFGTIGYKDITLQ